MTKLWFRILFATALALATGAAAHAQSLSPTGITASPASASPGDSVSYSITVNNGATTQFGNSGENPPAKKAFFPLTTPEEKK